MSTSPSSVVVSSGISSGVMSAGPTGVFYLGHPGTPISAPLPLVALAPLPPGGQLNPPVAGSNPSSPVVHGAGAPAVPVVRKSVSEMTDEEKFAEGICTRDHLRSITGGSLRFPRPSYLDSTFLISFDEVKEDASNLSYHHMIPAGEMIELWSTLRAVYVDSSRGHQMLSFEGLQLLRLSLIALLQLGSISASWEKSVMRPEGRVFSEEELNDHESSMRKDRFSDDLASEYLAELDSEGKTSGKRSDSALRKLFSHVMWMDFNLIRGPSTRSDDPAFNFDRFDDAILKLREKQKCSQKAQHLHLHKRISLVSALYLAYSTYKELDVESQDATAKASVEKALEGVCEAVISLRDWAKKEKGLSLQMSKKTMDYVLDGGRKAPVSVDSWKFSLTFTSYIEHSLWRRDGDKWAKLKKDEDSVGSPSPSGMVSPRRR